MTEPSTGFNFVEAQARAWEEIREWQQEATAEPLIPTKPGGSWDGPGASLDLTEGLRSRLPKLLAERQITNMLDIACGDWNWMRLVDLGEVEYTGWDVDPGRIERCRWRITHGDFGTVDRPNAQFEVANAITVEEIPYYDLVLCRDFLAHLPNDYISLVVSKIKAGGSEWLLASNYPDADNSYKYNPAMYAWLGYLEHPVNLEIEPFNLQKVDAIPEQSGPGGVLTEPHELGLFLIGNA